MARCFRCLALAFVGAQVACFDWTVRAVTTGDDSGSSRDVSVDADRPAEAGDASMGPDAPPVAKSCDVLASEMAAAVDRARTCTLVSGQCTTKVADGCGCARFVAVAGSAESKAMATLAAEFRAAGCTTGCGTCAFLPITGVCVLERGQLRCTP